MKFLETIRRRLSNIISFKLFVIAFFVGFLIIGAYTYKDYGFPCDEIYALDLAHRNINFINHTNQSLLTYTDRYHGPFFEIILTVISRNISIVKEINTRHICIFVFFFIGLILFFDVAKKVIKDEKWALLATFLLAFSPRIFANSFYNSKDIPFLTSAILCIWSFIRWIQSLEGEANNNVRLILSFFHAFTLAAATTIRIPGIVFIFLTTFITFLSAIQNRSRFLIYVKFYLITFALFMIFTFVFWPILWHDPIDEFISAISLMKRYPINRDIFYLGKFYSPGKLPWHYLPVWISISTPILVIFGFLVGNISLLLDAIRQLTGRNKTKHDSVFFQKHHNNAWIYIICWCYLPILAIFTFDSVIYDGWRHLFFIYPAILLISIYGLRFIWSLIAIRKSRSLILQWTYIILLVAGLAEPIRYIIQNHPYEYVYFNPLAGTKNQLRSKFDLDYWGLSYKQAIDYTLNNDSRDWFTIYSPTTAGLYYIEYMLPESQRARVGIVDSPGQADYFMSEYRWHPQDYPYGQKYYSINVEGAEIMVVYKLSEVNP